MAKFKQWFSETAVEVKAWISNHIRYNTVDLIIQIQNSDELC